MKPIEQALMMRDPRKFLEEMNKMLQEGWTVKPGCWNCQTVQKLPNERTPASVVMQNGVALDVVYFAVLVSPQA